MLVSQSPHLTRLQCNPAAEPAGNTDFKVRDFLFARRNFFPQEDVCAELMLHRPVWPLQFYHRHNSMTVVTTLLLWIWFLLTITCLVLPSDSPSWSLSMPRTVKTLTRLPVKCCWSFLRESYFRENSLICLITMICIFSWRRHTTFCFCPLHFK